MFDNLYLFSEYAITLKQLKLLHGSIADGVFLANIEQMPQCVC